MKKKTHIEELLTEPLRIDDEESIERLTETLEQPSNPTRDSKCRPISTEELWEIIDKAAKDIYEKEKRK